MTSGGTQPEAVVQPAEHRDLLHLRRSPLFAGWLVLIHGAALVPLWLSGLPPFAPGFAGAAILMHAAWTVRRHALLVDRRSIIAIGVDTSLRCVLVRRDGTSVRGTVAETTLVAGRLVALAVRTVRWRPLCHVLVVPGMLDAESFRSLRVRLRWGRAQAPAVMARASHA